MGSPKHTFPKKHQDSSLNLFHSFHPDMYLSSILIAVAAAMSQAAPLQDSTSRTAHLSRVEIQQFLQASDQFMFDNRKDDSQDLRLHVQTRHARRDADCSTYPSELQVFCFSVFGDGEDYYDTPTITPLEFDEIIGIDSFESSQTGWTA